MRNTTAVAAGAAALLALAGPVHAQEVLKIGAVVTLSGAGAAWGQGMLYAAELAADDVNAKGGLDVGGKKYKVQVVAYDDKYQANEAVTAVNRLVFEDKVKYLIGPVGSAAALAVSPITEKNGVIMMTLGFTPKVIGADKPHTFRPNLTTMETSQPQIDWVVKTRGVKKVGALFPNDETGQQIAADLEKAYAKAGSQLAAKEFFERERVDMVPLLTRMMAKGIDAIELDGNAPGTAGLIVKQARELGFKGLIIRSGGPSTPEIVSVAGNAVTEGMLVNTTVDPANAAVKAYSERYQAKYKKRMNGFSPAFYDGSRMLFQAITTAGTTDTAKVRTALEGINHYQGILGTLTWTGKAVYGADHQISAPFYIAEVKGGQEVIRARCTLTACQ
ncbi:ABC transporter substrate-binding protein [Cupriavidus respiraculi]|uniref:ABC transporter substrate-binding protein n=1 Tax=Cupriavidus respiraculi TaxID=195930 RepID=UPI001C97FCF7|nr:ABC transporter substrate-binding protein [Cupriavidus respiraculi]MBY4948097.1 ABC transporter substrate-binding protein [Cupriavidus respiraculi]